MMLGQLTDKKQGESKSSWDTYKVTFDYYQFYLNQKEERGLSRYNLDFTDLLYASNYKAGSGSIQENLLISEGQDKLEQYSGFLKRVNNSFGVISLGELDNEGLALLLKYAKEMVVLCVKYHIKGLGVPYCSALVHLHFPNLIPVLDRNALLGLELITCEKIPKSGQVMKIEQYYEDLIKSMYEILTVSGVTLRELDRKVFFEGQWAWSQHNKSKNS